MRALLWAPLLLVGGTLPAASLAQQAATRSVDDYVCAFTDDCADSAQPEDSGTARKGRTSSTRGFSLKRAPATSEVKTNSNAAPAAPTARNRRVVGQALAKTQVRNKPAPAAKEAKLVKAAQRRVDLRLTFETGSASMTEQAKQEARVFAEALGSPKLAERKFVIEGHTDSVGSRAYNLDLSRRRADAVVEYLTGLGVNRSRLRTVGYGFDRPLDGRSARAEENRRVEAVLGS
ncbi:MAG: hypothetical protein AVDCRST_MAG91-1946 [uncultured Sphingomonadaceae bacterium]|uniref:OmpA-like domain-containing protein n=1 Tax=uncultured Sphingomonadaceae bacterium TaxID=169976 RepID=A0A6J4T926_9SPHN|nr:MAG: hypothetical protein AVDCRST_MAG91-1946 [uncultured Sphingomonadaceae bacterium]